MNEKLTIGQVSKLTGLSVKAIRFYEDGGYIPAAQRSESRYRVYSSADLARLHLTRRTRLLGVPLPEIRELLDKAFAANCADFSVQLVGLIDRQEQLVKQRLAELRTLQSDLQNLREHISHCECDPDVLAAECDYCTILGQEGGQGDE